MTFFLPCNRCVHFYQESQNLVHAVAPALDIQSSAQSSTRLHLISERMCPYHLYDLYDWSRQFSQQPGLVSTCCSPREDVFNLPDCSFPSGVPKVWIIDITQELTSAHWAEEPCPLWFLHSWFQGQTVTAACEHHPFSTYLILCWAKYSYLRKPLWIEGPNELVVLLSAAG
jgi:hypothetical protein